MPIRMVADSTIYTAINAMLPIVAPERAILASVEVSVTSKANHKKSQRGHVHFLFERPRGTYIRVLFSTEKCVCPEMITDWTQSAYNDGMQVVGHDGIGRPLYSLAQKLLDQLGGNWQEVEVEACWLLGEPKVVRLTNLKKVSKKQFDFRYKASVEIAELNAVT